MPALIPDMTSSKETGFGAPTTRDDACYDTASDAPREGWEVWMVDEEPPRFVQSWLLDWRI